MVPLLVAYVQDAGVGIARRLEGEGRLGQGVQRACWGADVADVAGRVEC